MKTNLKKKKKRIEDFTMSSPNFLELEHGLEALTRPVRSGQELDIEAWSSGEELNGRRFVADHPDDRGQGTPPVVDLDHVPAVQATGTYKETL
jgi:hypothetical protein